MSEPHAQDKVTWSERRLDQPAAPPAPANQWTAHDGGIEPAPPSRSSVARALQRMAHGVRNMFGGRER